jgi:HK97 family phage portal protein
MVSLWHPLVGISPIYACGMSATMGNKIQANSTQFFANASRPSGALTAPGKIDDETANRLKTEWEKNYGSGNIGRLAVLGNGLAYSAMTIPAVDAQMIEQLRWTAEDVARAFHVPMWKIGGVEPARTSVESLNQTYYSDCLQSLIESAEALLNQGLEVPDRYEIEFCLEGLLRMDTAAQYTTLGEGVKGSLMAPNEARKRLNLKPLTGGDTIYMQQQNYSLEALAKRDQQDDPFGTAKPAALPAPDPAANDAAMNEQAAKQAKELIEYISKGLACST